MTEQDKYTLARERMVAEQLAARGIKDARVLQAMKEIPRHLFIPEESRHLAYEDRPVPIGNDQTISQPHMVAIMSELLGLRGNEKVLEIGTGSGYQSAILGHLAGQVYSVERHEALASQAEAVHAQIVLPNVVIVVGDGSAGLDMYAPYDAIIVTAAAPRVNKAWLRQLADHGKLLVPVGSHRKQVLELWRREGERIVRKKLMRVSFVPLLGHKGWSKSDWKS